jgi:hypothetical protein
LIGSRLFALAISQRASKQGRMSIHLWKRMQFNSGLHRADAKNGKNKDEPTF